jgi:hypothetical protein
MKDKWKRRRTGTSFRGYILSTYEQICASFGDPVSKGDGYKIDTEWIIKTPSGFATIYNYKDGHAYLGDKGLDVEKICEWHVGGKNAQSYDWVKNELVARVYPNVKV